MHDSDYDYHRLIITTTLTTKSPLHIGTGEAENLPATDKNDQGSLNTVLTDQQGKPYLPASTLRGYLRSVVLSAEQNALRQHGASERLFGVARQPGPSANDEASTDTNHGNMGALRIYDACLENPDSAWKGIISRTAIDPVTLTAKQHSLNLHQVVNSDVAFKLHLELDRVTTADAELLLGALATLNHQDGLIGKGKSTGQGKLSHGKLSISGQSREAFAAWVLSDQTEIDYSPVVLTATPLTLNVWHSEEIQLTALSPVLVNDPEAAEAEQGEHTPDLVFMQRGGKAIIPGSTLKGWLRGHCRRILLTIANDPHHKKAQDNAEKLLGELFGGTNEGAGYLRFSDAEVEVKANRIHEQTFTAVDRFTGGVKDTALYNVQAIYPDEVFKSKLLWRAEKPDKHGEPQTLKAALKLLLLFALRDATEGDLVLGWGKSKGYGRLQLSSEIYPNWEMLRDALFMDTAAVEKAFQVLQNKLNDEVDNG